MLFRIGSRIFKIIVVYVGLVRNVCGLFGVVLGFIWVRFVVAVGFGTFRVG